MKNTHLLFAALIASCGFCVQAVAADEPTKITIPIVTRLVKIISNLETDLMDAVQKRDAPVLEKMLSDDFELRAGTVPGQPTPRAEWIKQALKDPVFSSSIEQMAAHEYANTVIVSFLWMVDAPKGSKFAKQYSVVDTWTHTGDTWHINARYITAIGTASAHVPGHDRDVIVIKKKI